MSWEKTTVFKSEIDSTKELLEELKIPYKLKIRGYVDDHSAWSEDKIPLRVLFYKDKAIYEQMVRVQDCDLDDVVISVKIDKSKFKKNIPLEQVNKVE